MHNMQKTTNRIPKMMAHAFTVAFVVFVLMLSVLSVGVYLTGSAGEVILENLMTITLFCIALSALWLNTKTGNNNEFQRHMITHDEER